MFTKIQNTRVNLNLLQTYESVGRILEVTMMTKKLYFSYDSTEECIKATADLDKLIQNAGLYPYKFKP